MATPEPTSMPDHVSEPNKGISVGKWNTPEFGYGEMAKIPDSQESTTDKSTNNYKPTRQSEDHEGKIETIVALQYRNEDDSSEDSTRGDQTATKARQTETLNNTDLQTFPVYIPSKSKSSDSRWHKWLARQRHGHADNNETVPSSSVNMAPLRRGYQPLETENHYPTTTTVHPSPHLADVFGSTEEPSGQGSIGVTTPFANNSPSLQWKGQKHRHRLMGFIRTRKHLKAYSCVMNHAKPAIEDTTLNEFEAYDGPMHQLWNVHRLRQSSSSRKDPKHAVFTDAWILREVQLTNQISPNTPFPMHLEQTFEGSPSDSQVDPDFFSIWKLTLSPDGQYLLVGTQRGWIYLFQTCPNHTLGIFDDHPAAIFKAHEGCVIDVVWLPTDTAGGPMFASIGFDRRLCLWEARSPVACDSVRTAEWSSSLCLHPLDPSQLFLGSLDATVQLWRIQIEENNETKTTVGRCSMIDYVRVPDVVTAVSISPDAEFLAVGVRRGSVAIYDANTLRFITEVECASKRSKKWKSSGSQRVVGLCWAQGSAQFIVTSHDSTIRLVDLSANGPQETANRSVRKFTGHTLQRLLLKAAYVVPNCRGARERIVMTSEDNSLYCYTPQAPNETEPIPPDHIRVSDELVTASVLTNSSFDAFVNEEIHNAIKRRLGTRDHQHQTGQQKPLEEQPIHDKTSSNRWINPKYLGMLFGTMDGTIKVFANFGLERF